MKISYHYTFPFGKIEKKESIILWGLGVVGKQYVKQIEETAYCNILFAVDREWKTKEKLDSVEVKAPEEIKNYSDVKIVVAVSNPGIFAEIEGILLSWGINCDRIIHDCKQCEDYIVDTDTEMKEQIGNVLHQLSDVWSVVQLMERVLLSMESMLQDFRFKGDNLSVAEINHFKRVHNVLPVIPIKARTLVRIGNPHDGGYVMVDDFLDNGGVAYSFGISSDVTWDKDMAKRGYDVYMYDHTIEQLPEQDERFHFRKMGIAARKDEIGNTLNTLEYFIRENKHEKKSEMILKMDVEGAEYGFLNMVNRKTLEQFNQIVLELHGITSDNLTEQIVEGLSNLNKTHQLIHIHGNNYSRIKYVNSCIFPDSLEVLYVRRDLYQFDEEQGINQKFEADSPCWGKRDEISLENWNKYSI